MFEASQQQSFFNKQRKTLKNGRKHLNKHKKTFVKGKQNVELDNFKKLFRYSDLILLLEN